MTEHGGDITPGTVDQEIFRTKIISVDGEAAIEIPPTILAKLRLEVGDTLSMEVAGHTRALIGRKVPAPRD